MKTKKEGKEYAKDRQKGRDEFGTRKKKQIKHRR